MKITAKRSRIVVAFEMDEDEARILAHVARLARVAPDTSEAVRLVMFDIDQGIHQAIAGQSEAIIRAAGGAPSSGAEDKPATIDVPSSVPIEPKAGIVPKFT